MYVNTLITTIDQEKVKCLGYVYENTLSPKHLFQFADDTAIATALESDNQLLMNVFTKWSNWADFTIRVDKCHVFGIRKNKTDSCQYLPKAIVNAQRIPVVPLEESFDYLGKSFNYKMDTGPVEVSLCDDLKNEDIRRLYKLTSTKNIRSDEVVESAVLISDMVRSVKKCCDMILESSRENLILQELLDLRKQSSIIQHISAHCTKSAIGQWHSMVSHLPQSIYQFSRKVSSCVCPPKLT